VKPRRVIAIALLALASAAAFASCSTGPSVAVSLPVAPEGDGPTTTFHPCEPNKAAKCVGEGGCAGGMLCGPAGTYGVCACIGDTGSLPDGESFDVFDALDATSSSDGADVAHDALLDSPSISDAGPDSSAHDVIEPPDL
jgi:hypothetical protein